MTGASGPRPRLQVILTPHGAMAHITGAGPVRDIGLSEDALVRILEEAAGALLHVRAISRRPALDDDLPPDNTHMIEG